MRLDYFDMYTNDPSGLIELLLFYAVSAISALLCLIAVLLIAGFHKVSSIVCSIGSMVLSIISGLLFALLLASNIFSNGHGKFLCLFFVMPFCISAFVCWFSSRRPRA